jgi:hypothetical protein
MRGFGRRNDPLDELGRELRRRRSQPRSEFLERQVTRIEGSRPTERHGITMRSRLVLAVSTTALLCVAAGASGGLGYARSATSHTVHAVAHVFTEESTTQSQQSSASRQDAQQGRDTSHGRSNDGDEGDDNRSNGSGEHGHDHGDHGHNPSDDQYGKFVFVCLRVPPKHPFVFITLRLPRQAAEHLIAKGLATPGPC